MNLTTSISPLQAVVYSLLPVVLYQLGWMAFEVTLFVYLALIYIRIHALQGDGGDE